MEDLLGRKKLVQPDWNLKITDADIEKAEQVLVDNGIEEDEAQIVLQALGYVLMDVELYTDGEEEDEE